MCTAGSRFEASSCLPCFWGTPELISQSAAGCGDLSCFPPWYSISVWQASGLRPVVNFISLGWPTVTPLFTTDVSTSGTWAFFWVLFTTNLVQLALTCYQHQQFSTNTQRGDKLIFKSNISNSSATVVTEILTNSCENLYLQIIITCLMVYFLSLNVMFSMFYCE